jgi:hypothetical protein
MGEVSAEDQADVAPDALLIGHRQDQRSSGDEQFGEVAEHLPRVLEVFDRLGADDRSESLPDPQRFIQVLGEPFDLVRQCGRPGGDVST